MRPVRLRQGLTVDVGVWLGRGVGEVVGVADLLGDRAGAGSGVEVANRVGEGAGELVATWSVYVGIAPVREVQAASQKKGPRTRMIKPIHALQPYFERAWNWRIRIVFKQNWENLITFSYFNQ